MKASSSRTWTDRCPHPAPPPSPQRQALGPRRRETGEAEPAATTLTAHRGCCLHPSRLGDSAHSGHSKFRARLALRGPGLPPLGLRTL